MRRVFTVYNCGTNFNRERIDEVIANLADRTEGAEYRPGHSAPSDWMINEGVGSKPSSRTSPARMPGLSDPVTGFKNHTPRMVVWLKGIIRGYGWRQNVARALAVIKELIHPPYRPLANINMAGWSRGAITCHMLAHALWADRYTRDIPVNIFAFDPVPGPGNSGHDQVSLPPNVNRYEAVVMEDEFQKIMKPVVFNPLADASSPKKIKNIPLPGAHGTAVFRLGSEVATIGAALAHQFLHKHGTRLRNPLLLSDLAYCELYTKVRMDIRKYHGMRGSLILRKLSGEHHRIVRNYLRDTAYFINANHARKFASTFPDMWRIMTIGARNYKPVTVDRAIASIRSRAPTTYQSLVDVGIL
jgi:hypothetical protein